MSMTTHAGAFTVATRQQTDPGNNRVGFNWVTTVTEKTHTGKLRVVTVIPTTDPVGARRVHQRAVSQYKASHGRR